MTIDSLIDIINESCNDISFIFHGMPAGVMPEVNNYVKTFHVWYGENQRDYSNAADVVNDKFFDGQSVKDIFDEITNLTIS